MKDNPKGRRVPGGPVEDRTIEVDKAVYEDAELYESENRATDTTSQPDADA